MAGNLRTRARRRAKTVAKLKARHGTERQICATAITLCRERLAEAGCRLNFGGVRELIWLLQRVLHTTKDGARLPLREFSSPTLGHKLRDALCETHLLFCPNPGAWRPSWEFLAWNDSYDLHGLTIPHPPSFASFAAASSCRSRARYCRESRPSGSGVRVP